MAVGTTRKSPRKVKANRELDKVFAPLFVGQPPADAFIGLCMLEDGEIRHYNYGAQRDEETWYVYSRDRGITWKTKRPPKGMSQRQLLMRADTRDPVSGEYIRLAQTPLALRPGATSPSGTALIRSRGGHRGTWSARKVLSRRLSMLKPPVFIRGGARILVCTQLADHPEMNAAVAYSDDRGRTWKLSNAVTIPRIKDWRRRARWNHGPAEPSAVELSDGRLWVLLRTGRGRFWETFSTDGGETLSVPRPSRFFSCKTMPTWKRLEDGRILLTWCNTVPLPPLPRTETTRILMGNLRQEGIATDMFSNRDACHAAISEDDGRTWIGFREMYLDRRRNAGDYALTGGIDRGVHQSQFVELGEGKVLVSLGQHWLHRSLVIFDLDWLYERSRESHFANGLDDWSVHTYYAGVLGHRALNRKAGAELLPHPDRRGRRVLHLCRPHEPELITENQGAVWNFPAARAGRFTARLMLRKGGQGFRISLLDRWYNPTDLTAHRNAMFALEVSTSRPTKGGLRLASGRWHELRFEWEGLAARRRHRCRLLVDGKRRADLPLQQASRNGISYVHFLSTAGSEDRQGFLVESVRGEVT